MKARDILNPQKKKAKHLWSGKSFDDLKLAASPEMSSDGKYNSPLLTPRSLSFGASSTRAVSQRIACLSVTHPHTPDAYELINKCGHGATAEVWRAHCKPLGEDVAIKIVDLEKAGRNMETIVHEAELLCGLRHPHILPLLSCFTKEDNLWMVLPYVEGGSVESAMKYAFPQGLPERVVGPIVLPILKALAYLHKHDIVHRDVKASNILLDCNNILLGDFGTAAAMERSMVNDGKAAFGQYLSRTTYVGTPAWMAPEIIEQCQEGHSTKADIYSFGVTLLEMARGKVPFAGLPLEVMAMTKLHHPSPSLEPTYEGRNFSAEMQDIVALCLEKDPQKRPTAEQLLKHRFFKHVKSPKAALEEILTGVPGPVQRLSSLTRRSTEKNLIGGEEAASYGADERVSIRSQKSKEARLSTKFDAQAAVVLLNKMLRSSCIPGPIESESPDSLTAAPVQNGDGHPLREGKGEGNITIRPSHASGWSGKSDLSWETRNFPASAPTSCLSQAGSLPALFNNRALSDNTRESVVLYSGNAFRERAIKGCAFKLSGQQLVDAMEEGLEVEAICDLLKDESSSCEGVAFRHYSSHKSWKSVSGVVHVDHVANERLYSKPVQPEQILNGKVPPPTSFKPLIDLLISSEDGRYEKIPPISDADSDYSSAGYQNGLEHTLSIGSAMSGMKVGDSPVTSPRDGDTAFSSAHESLPTPSLSSFHESNLFSVPSVKGLYSNNISLASWVENDNSGTPPPDSVLHGPAYYSASGETLGLIRTGGSDVSICSKGDSALDLASLCEHAMFEGRSVRGESPQRGRGTSPSRVVETFRSISPFARSSSQDVKPASSQGSGEGTDIDLALRPSRPFSPSGPNPKPPKHPRSLSQAMTGLKL